MHVVVPILPEHDWQQIKNFCHTYVNYLVSSHPTRYIGEMSKAKRRNKIFIDYLRNQRGATSICAYSTRARIHAPISTPIEWDELTKDIQDTYFTIITVVERIRSLKNLPWKDFFKIKQSLKRK